MVNAVTCLTCGARIESKYRHDYVVCACGPDSATMVAVDGGQDYQRRASGSMARWREESDGAIFGVADGQIQEMAADASRERDI